MGLFFISRIMDSPINFFQRILLKFTNVFVFSFMLQFIFLSILFFLQLACTKVHAGIVVTLVSVLVLASHFKVLQQMMTRHCQESYPVHGLGKCV